MAIDKERKRAIAKFIKEEMEDKLKLCKSNAHGSTQQRNKCPKKPYQNDTLSCKCFTVSENKKKFKKCQTISEKQTIRAGKHGGNIPVIHAKTIGKLGVHKERQRRILKESNNKDKWQFNYRNTGSSQGMEMRMKTNIKL